MDVPEAGARREPLLCALGGRLKNPKKERRKFSQPVLFALPVVLVGIAVLLLRRRFGGREEGQ